MITYKKPPVVITYNRDLFAQPNTTSEFNDESRQTGTFLSRSVNKLDHKHLYSRFPDATPMTSTAWYVALANHRHICDLSAESKAVL